MADTRRTTTGRRVPEAEVESPATNLPALPSAERVQQELATAKRLDDFFGKEGIFARLFASTIEQMLQAELTAHLGYERYAADGRNSGNSRNGKRTRNLRTSVSDTLNLALPHFACRRHRLGCASEHAAAEQVRQRHQVAMLRDPA